MDGCLDALHYTFDNVGCRLGSIYALAKGGIGAVGGGLSWRRLLGLSELDLL